MRITTILGARPQFIKAAPVSRVLRRTHTERLVHTGQHYDPMMSQVFFDELAIPAPDLTLHVGSATHGAQTGRMLEAIEQDLLAHPPDAVLVYGDTNSTLAGALAAAKLGIPLVHVEAGLRSFVSAMPEEINRVLTDRLSRLRCCPSPTACDHLAAEGIVDGVVMVGDVMLDALRDAEARVLTEPHRVAAWGVDPGGYVLATVHRAANTDDPVRLRAILAALGQLSRPVLWPVHPRTRRVMQELQLTAPAQVRMVEPLGYLDLVAALRSATVVVTDSGGLQKEAYWMGVPCVTLRRETEWTETVRSGWNVLVDADTQRIVEQVHFQAHLKAQLHEHALAAGANALATPRDAYGVEGAADRVVQSLSLLQQS